MLRLALARLGRTGVPARFAAVCFWRRWVGFVFCAHASLRFLRNLTRYSVPVPGVPAGIPGVHGIWQTRSERKIKLRLWQTIIRQSLPGPAARSARRL